ncbi:MAG: radical SAM protein [Methanobacteriota archaeon]
MRYVQSTLAGEGNDGVGEVACSRAMNPSRLPGLSYALNPYVGCAHACSYCYAQDVLRLGQRGEWGSWAEAKRNLEARLSAELRRAKPGVIGLGTVTDPYQPAEAKRGLTRGCLEILRERNHPVCIQTKSDLALRDLELIAGHQSPEVGFTITTTDESLARGLEPGAPKPSARLGAAMAFADAGVKTWVFLGPVIFGVNDSEESVKAVVGGAADAGASKVIFDFYRSKPLADARMRATFGEDFFPRKRAPGVEATARKACMERGIGFELAFSR